MLVLFLSAAQAACPPAFDVDRCGTVAIREALLEDPSCTEDWLRAHQLGIPGMQRAPLRRGAVKTTSNPRNLVNEYETDNFVVRWGSSGRFVSVTEATTLGAALELAWQVEVEQLGHALPVGTDQQKLNVYVGDTGGPESFGVGGYYNEDIDGWPMLVLGPDWIGTEYGNNSAAHELFHAVQHGHGTYEYYGLGAWFYEASATWIQNEVYPNSSTYADFLAGFALLPELSLNFFDYYDTGALPEHHQYGAFIFVQLLDEIYGPEIVRELWETRSLDNDPLPNLHNLLLNRGSSLDTVWSEFIARNATWDYPHEAWYQDAIDKAWYVTSDAYHYPSGRLAVTYGNAVEGPADHLPHGYGANYWHLTSIDPDFVLDFEGEGGPRWHVWVVVQDASGHARIPVVTSAPSGRARIRHLDGAVDAWVVVGAATSSRDNDNTYNYTLSIEGLPKPEPAAPPPADEPTEEKRACACNSGVGPAWWLAWLAVAAARRSTR